MFRIYANKLRCHHESCLSVSLDSVRFGSVRKLILSTSRMIQVYAGKRQLQYVSGLSVTFDVSTILSVSKLKVSVGIGYVSKFTVSECFGCMSVNSSVNMI